MPAVYAQMRKSQANVTLVKHQAALPEQTGNDWFQHSTKGRKRQTSPLKTKQNFN